MIHDGVYPDLFGVPRAVRTDDLLAVLILRATYLVRAAAERTGRSVEEVSSARSLIS